MTSSNACSGVLGWIASLFGSSTPTYVGDGQPAASCGGELAPQPDRRAQSRIMT